MKHSIFWSRQSSRRGLLNVIGANYRGDRRNEREKEQLREALRIATRGIQQACAALLVDKLNELAVRFRKNKAEIDHLRWQLDVVRRPVRL